MEYSRYYPMKVSLHLQGGPFKNKFAIIGYFEVCMVYIGYTLFTMVRQHFGGAVSVFIRLSLMCARLRVCSDEIPNALLTCEIVWLIG